LTGGGVLGQTAFQSLSQPPFIRRWMSGVWRLTATGCFFTGTFIFMSFSVYWAGGVVRLASNYRRVSKIALG
jgi:hypothetical protein